MEERHEFDEVTLLSAFAVGVPGKRTFFLAMGEKGEWLRLWLEKEQLEALALAIDRLFFTLPQEHIRLPQEVDGLPLSDDITSGFPLAELEIDQIALSCEQEKAAIDLLVHVLGPRGQHPSEVYCQATLAQLRKLGSQAKSICAAGRPRCMLCGSPIDPAGHNCPKLN
jgi:uncharacterized repeat protein (TIGR03847 family)